MKFVRHGSNEYIYINVEDTMCGYILRLNEISKNHLRRNNHT